VCSIISDAFCVWCCGVVDGDGEISSSKWRACTLIHWQMHCSCCAHVVQRVVVLASCTELLVLLVVLVVTRVLLVGVLHGKFAGLFSRLLARLLFSVLGVPLECVVVDDKSLVMCMSGIDQIVRKPSTIRS
jgi:hypothetical protein